MDTLERADTLKVNKKTESCSFRFGNGNSYSSQVLYTIPITLGDIQATIDTHVIECDIPLLMSRESLKRAYAEIDFKSDTIRMFGQVIPTKTSQTGHLLLPLKGIITEDCYFTSPINTTDPDVYKKQVLKLHKQFAHPKPEKLKLLIKNSGISSNNINQAVDEISDACEICKRFKKPLPRPIVAMPSATEFNETVAMDIKFIIGHPVLHLIDHVTRYSAGCRLNNKKPESVVQAILTNWIRIFGHPKYFLWDNGGEFDNNDTKELCEKFNIHIKTTAAESPWSNGLCERANAILQNMVLKVMEDSKCSLDLAIPWAISAKNALSNTYGFSPNQLVFGKNINLPAVHNDLLPAKNTISSPLIAQHLMTLHKARQAFIHQESCEKLRRALNKQTRSYSDFQYVNGDKVFYKRSDQNEWHGPATVLGQDGSQFFLKHGSRYIRVHQCKMQPVKDYNIPSVSSKSRSQEMQPVNHNPQTEFTDSESEPEETSYTNNDQTIVEPDTTMDNIRQKPEASHERQVPQQSTTASRIPRALLRLKDFNAPPKTSAEVIEEEVFFGASSEKEKFKEAKKEEIKRWRENEVFEEIDDKGQPRISSRWVCTEKIK